jgi:hypothetical protein
MNRNLKISISFNNALSMLKAAKEKLFPDIIAKSNNIVEQYTDKRQKKRGGIIEKQSSISLPGMTIIEASSIHHNKNNGNPIFTITNFDLVIKPQPNYILNASLMPLSLGLVTMLYICNESINKSQ